MDDILKGLGFVLLLIVALPIAALVGAIWLLARLIREAEKESKKAAQRKRRLQAATAPPDEVGTPEHRVLGLPTNGREVFTPEPLLSGRVYRILLTGTYSFVTPPTGAAESDEGKSCRADAFYREDVVGNFTVSCGGIRLGTKPLSEVPHIVGVSDREAHTYSLLIDGDGQKLSVQLGCPGGDPLGTLRMEVVLLDPSTQTVADRRREELRRASVMKLERRVAQLRAATEMNRNWGDPSFLADVSKTRTASLLQERERIRQGFVALYDEDPFLVAHIRDYEPELFARLRGPVEAFLAAERRDAKPREVAPAVDPNEKKPQLTVEQVREGLVRRSRVVEDDQKALMKSKAEAWDEKATLLREAGLDEDEIAMAIGTKVDAISEVLGEFAESKGGPHAASQQLA